MKKMPLLVWICALATSTALLTAQDKPKSSSKPQWIWKDEKNAHETVFFHRQWTQRAELKSAILKISCDNVYTGYLNGKKFGNSSQWERPARYDLTKQVSKGDNVLAIEAANQGGIAGLVAELMLTNQDGSVVRIITDSEWMASRQKKEDWLAPSIAPEGWTPAISRGAMGDAPWGNIFTKTHSPPQPAGQKQIDAKVHPEGFTIEKIYTVDKATQGSWVSMAVDEKGRLYCCDQRDKGLFRVTFNNSSAPIVEKMPVNLTGAQGLLWKNNALYAGVNGGQPSSGLIRVSDSNGDDLLDKAEILRQMKQGGEHGIHGVVESPDGQSLYVVAGNHSPIPAPETSTVPMNYGEDQLLPSMVDARGHARNIKAPGGWIARTDLDGKSFELVSAGFRNQYDAAFNSHGELFTYDSDMEWDVGTPWYRPTRIYHVTGGSEFGWRTGSGKFPEWFPDVLPPSLDIGPGSPTGVLSGLGAKFPAKYQNAIYAFDWTYGTMYALHQKPVGSTYQLEKEEFVTGAPLNLTDGVISPADGNLYFAVGGRGTHSALYRVSYTGSESTEPAPAAAEGKTAELRALRRQLETFHTEKPGAVETAWPHLGHSDRFNRYAARMVLEHQTIDSWIEKPTANGDIPATLSVLLALARQGEAEHLPILTSKLIRALRGNITPDEKLEALRIFHLSAIRLGRPSDEHAKSLLTLLSAQYPSNDDRLNRELVYTLAYLKAPGLVAKTLPLLNQESIDSDSGVEATDSLLSRSRLGGTFAAAQRSQPQRQQMWYAYILRNFTEGWNDELRKQYFTWFSKAQSFKGGASFQGFIENIRKEALKNVPDETLRASLDTLSKKPPRLVPEGFEKARKIEVGVLPGLQFNTDRIEATGGEKIALVFLNDDPLGLMHNLAISTPGSAQKVIAEAIALGPRGVEKNYIPEIPEVLDSTPQIAPGKKYTLYFEVPLKKGDYHFICTYPGHGAVMQGIFAVK